MGTYNIKAKKKKKSVKWESRNGVSFFGGYIVGKVVYEVCA